MKGTGWRRDLPDQRDYAYVRPKGLRIPSSIDLSKYCPPIFDQGQLGSCTANAICAALAFDEIKQGMRPTVRSRLFVYYNERAMEGTVASDAGAEIRDGIKSVAKQGACPESLWPYRVSKFARKPNATCYRRAQRFEALTYERVPQTEADLKSIHASERVFVFGFTVYESFESGKVAQTGIVPMPGKNERVIGGHAVYSDGFDDATGEFDCPNSWSPSWGQHGRFKIPYEYVLDPNLAADFWVISTVGRPS